MGFREGWMDVAVRRWISGLVRIWKGERVGGGAGGGGKSLEFESKGSMR
jgi:hypothetical protein